MNRNFAPEFPSFPGFSAGKRKRLAVILAGGDGSRLKSITRAIAGDERPKQFCPILGEATLLDRTRERVALKFEPDSVYFSLTRKHESFFRGPMWDVPMNQQVIQPENKGTAPAILYTLLRIASDAPDASVAFFPSDHYFSDDESFMDHVEAAFRSVDVNPESIVLLGIKPEKAETAYGWIEPAESLFGDMQKSITRVKRFWEKPSSSAAKRLMSEGCLWNSFVMVGRVNAFLDMFRKHLPDLYRMFDATRPSFGKTTELAAVKSVYSWIAPSNFSGDVLEKATDRLMVMRVGDVGWCDWGEPQRVLGTLVDLGIKPAWAGALAS